MGQGGIFKPLRTAWTSRFTAIKAFVMVPAISEKLTLTVHFSTQLDDDVVTLKSRNWQTGIERTLYHGSLTNGTLKKIKQPKD